MSCTENESGPFVVFFLPAVVGCLTILLARRWACSQVNNTSSTGISRRRKIVKDPLIKRPLPTIPCKMVAPGSKKSSGVTKKGSIPTCDDESTNSGKRANRGRLPTSPTITSTDQPRTDVPVPPKHVPFPYVPQDSELMFECMTLMFTLVITGLQFLNVYRTNWWLPNSIETQTMHFHLIDPHLVTFIVTVLSRRLAFSLLMLLIRPFVAPKMIGHVTFAARIFLLGIQYGFLLYCGIFLLLKHSMMKIFLLCYPSVIYILLFGINPAPLVELGHNESPMHSCSHDPMQLRSEVEMLRSEFNSRVKKILYNSIVEAYYSSFIPCCFAPNFVYFEVMAASQQVCLVWGALCCRYTAQLLPAAFVDACHRAAIHLGQWKPMKHHELTEGPEVREWSCRRYWGGGARVRHAGRGYVATGPLHASVAAQPDHAPHLRFYAVFRDSSAFLCLLLCLQLSLVLLQICLLFSSLAWNHFLAIVMLLFINYYTLFKLTRQYFIAWRVSKAEEFILEKN